MIEYTWTVAQCEHEVATGWITEASLATQNDTAKNPVTAAGTPW